MSTEALEGVDPEPGDTPITRMDLNEFRDLGYLQEVNRLFFHPRGLALEVNADVLVDGAVVTGDAARTAIEDGTGTVVVASLGGIWDYRSDPEGMVFGGTSGVRVDKAENVEHERLDHLVARELRYGWKDGIQPVAELNAGAEHDGALD